MKAPSDVSAAHPRLILASASPRRRDLLSAYGYDALVAPADVTESDDPFLSVRERVLLNAVRKSAAHGEWSAGAFILGVDTLVCLDGQALGKPADHAEAARMVARLGGRTHQVFTGVALREADTGRVHSFVDESRVSFRSLDAARIAAYHALINPLDKAGGYAAQEHGAKIISHLEGSWTNVMGLPMERLAVLLASRGIHPTLPLGELSPAGLPPARAEGGAG